jgi:hypothetical protein
MDLYTVITTIIWLRFIYLLFKTGWWFGTLFLIFHILRIIIPTDALHHFSVGISPTSHIITNTRWDLINNY